MKFVTISINESLHYKFKNKCKYNDYTNNHILTRLINSFVEGKYDEELGIEKETGVNNG
jgi:hypothetical protein